MGWKDRNRKSRNERWSQKQIERIHCKTFDQAEREKERESRRGVEMSSAERGLLAEVLIRKSSGTYCMVIGGRI